MPVCALSLWSSVWCFSFNGVLWWRCLVPVPCVCLNVFRFSSVMLAGVVFLYIIMLQMAPWAVLFSSWWSWCGVVRQMWKFFLLLSFCLFFVWRKSPFYIALARVFAVKSSFFTKKNKKNHIYALLFQILLSLCIVNLNNRKYYERTYRKD